MSELIIIFILSDNNDANRTHSLGIFVQSENFITHYKLGSHIFTQSYTVGAYSESRSGNEVKSMRKKDPQIFTLCNRNVFSI